MHMQTSNERKSRQEQEITRQDSEIVSKDQEIVQQTDKIKQLKEVRELRWELHKA